MTLKTPPLDNRTYQDLLNEALARISVHNPEWTNFNRSDPGVTLLELFAFLTESLLYRCNQIPERNHRKFLSLLGIPLQPATPAQGLVAFSNERGPLDTLPLNADLEVRAGQVPFRTQAGLDVLPIETQVYYKRRTDDPSGQGLAQYNQFYALQNNGALPAMPPLFYETVPFTTKAMNAGGIDLSRDTVDNSLWLALLVRAVDTPYATKIDAVRQAIAGKTVSLGIVPTLSDATRTMLPVDQEGQEQQLQYMVPKIPPGGLLPDDYRLRTPRYLPLDAHEPKNVLLEPGVVEVTLPGDVQQLSLWSNLSPFESGTGEFPPALEDTTLSARLITWLRVSAPPTAQVRLLWLGINTTPIIQQAYVANELLPDGTGEPDQVVTLSKTPIVSSSVQLTVTTGKQTEVWQETDDLLCVPAEVPVTNSWISFTTSTGEDINATSKAFNVDLESGDVQFGDGMHGARPPYQAKLRASYAYSVGPAGNVAAGSIKTSSALPPGFTLSNPIRTWGGAAGETVAEAERQMTHFLRHQDRLLSRADFAAITLRTPGVDIGRVEVLPAYNPALVPSLPGDTPGAVTIMVIPASDPDQPDAPRPDRLFLDTISAYLEPRRLVTTELFLYGPIYKPIWVSLGIKLVPGAHASQVREAVKAAIVQFLAPLTPESPLPVVGIHATYRGWPLHKPVVALELLAVASRVEGVMLVQGVQLAEGYNPGVDQVTMSGLELPHLAGMVVSLGEPLSLEQLRGQDELAFATIWGGGARRGRSGAGGAGGPDDQGDSSGPNGPGGPGGSSGPGDAGGPGGPGGFSGAGGPGGINGVPRGRRPGSPFVPLPVVPEECK